MFVVRVYPRETNVFIPVLVLSPLYHSVIIWILLSNFPTGPFSLVCLLVRVCVQFSVLKSPNDAKDEFKGVASNEFRCVIFPPFYCVCNLITTNCVINGLYIIILHYFVSKIYYIQCMSIRTASVCSLCTLITKLWKITINTN